MDWRDKIKMIRNVLCITQEELAQLLHVSFVSVNRWENGHFEPTTKIKRKIIRLLKEIDGGKLYE